MSLNNNPNNKNWWCFNCKKWIDKKLETTEFPIYANGTHVGSGYRCNHCQRGDTGFFQTINICTTCKKIVRVIGQCNSNDEHLEEELCSHQNNENPNNPNQPSNGNSNNFNWTPLLITGLVFAVIGIGVWLFMRSKHKKNER